MEEDVSSTSCAATAASTASQGTTKSLYQRTLHAARTLVSVSRGWDEDHKKTNENIEGESIRNEAEINKGEGDNEDDNNEINKGECDREDDNNEAEINKGECDDEDNKVSAMGYKDGKNCNYMVQRRDEVYSDIDEDDPTYPGDYSPSQGGGMNMVLMINKKDSEIKRLKKELLKFQQTVEELQRMNSNKKSDGRKRNVWAEGEHENGRVVNKWCSDTFKQLKWLPPGWEIYNAKNKNTLCAMVMSKVQVPDRFTPAWYYNNKIIQAVNNKYIDMKANITSRFKAEYKGTFITIYHYIVIFHIEKLGLKKLSVKLFLCTPV